MSVISDFNVAPARKDRPPTFRIKPRDLLLMRRYARPASERRGNTFGSESHSEERWGLRGLDGGLLRVLNLALSIGKGTEYTAADTSYSWKSFAWYYIKMR